MVRKIVGIAVGLILLAASFYVAKSLVENNKRPVFEVPKTVKTVYTQSVLNTDVPIVVEAKGNLVASRKIELYAEVQGILQETSKAFKAGQAYRKGEILMDIDSREYYTSLLAQRSTLYDLITGMMPDLRFDYEESFEQWQTYLNNFDLNENVKPLPEPVNDQERYFVNGRQVVTTYYTIKNMEERYSKYKITAPFDGILTESLVNPGTLVRSGQKMGEFVSLNDFELEVNVNQEFLDILRVGEPVLLTNLSGAKEWDGIVKRVNGRIDQATQTVTVYIGVKGSELIEGMYMEAKIAGRSENNAIEIPRSLLINDSEVFAVEGDKLVVKEVNTVYFTDETAVIKGLPDGTQLVNRPVAGGYSGMLVKIAPSRETGTIEQ
ncbi:RND family efflux transporter MFP subunit [Roseivirga pacifica]|uniref:RND family efflux transporter, MFP subunit n=1 Tax=Roseivirga pacifica TaxID=1267423 RepID=A0A1I0QIH3_9BACT|nr:HlyD family efflux transporter periplasmic adaptor subunit [Roseivirga pacifica]RKQ42878.1 RND family efflux transporter MFP subunit [Roseivirga pacifica]SEW26997.1 RND family efflux transporter, MFP subunit [Roseivirga pacifica]